MTTTEQIKALAELDGYKWNTRQPMQGGGWMERDDKGYCWCDENYLTSYDVIIPLVQKKVTSQAIHSFQDALGIICAKQYSCDEGTNYEYQGDGSYFEYWLVFNATPAQLCEALLRATNKWKD